MYQFLARVKREEWKMEILGTYPSVGACFSQLNHESACASSFSAGYLPDALDPSPDDTHSDFTAFLGT